MDENRFEGAAREIGGKVEGAFGNVTGDTKSQADGTIDQVVGKAQQVYGKVKDQAGSIKDQASGMGSSLVDQLDDASAYLSDTVADRPLTALLVAGAVGYVLAMLTRR